MNEKDMQKLLKGLENYVSGTYQNSDAYALIHLDRQGKVSGSFFASNSEEAAHLEGIISPSLLEAGADLKQLDRYSKIRKLEGSEE